MFKLVKHALMPVMCLLVTLWKWQQLDHGLVTPVCYDKNDSHDKNVLMIEELLLYAACAYAAYAQVMQELQNKRMWQSLCFS